MHRHAHKENECVHLRPHSTELVSKHIQELSKPIALLPGSQNTVYSIQDDPQQSFDAKLYMKQQRSLVGYEKIINPQNIETWDAVAQLSPKYTADEKCLFLGDAVEYGESHFHMLAW